MDLFMDDMEVIPALPPINDGDCKEDEDCASATEKIKGSGDTITSQSIKEQPNKSDQFASPPTPSRGETMPRDAEELSTEAAIEGSIQRSYEIMNESTDILKDKDASDFFNDSPSPTWGEKAIPSGNASDKCGANDDDSTEEHLDLSVEDADDSDYNANNEAKHSKIAVGDSATSTKPENIRSDDKNSKKSASGNAMQFNDDDSMDSNAEAPFVNSNPEVIMMFRYYAVRVGYARASFFREDEDGLEKQYETRYFNKAAPMVKIRSAIFLYWDDARQFLENIENLDKDSSLEFKVEYDGFDSIAEAEAYLLEPDTNLAWEHATSSGMTYPEVEDRNQIPATSYYYNFHEQYPLPHLHIPYLLPFAPFASEINTMPIVPGKPFYGVPDDREMNLAPSSIETRSRAKSTRTSIIATPLPTNKSNLTRGRPKAGTRKPNLRPQPKNLTSKENEEQKEANIIPATSYYYGFRDQYPVPRYYFPYTSPLVPVTNELGVHPITELNLASASVKTRSKTKVTRASAPKTTPRKMKSKPARERPKALTPESAVSDELEDKKIMNPRPPKVTQSRKPPKKKFEAIQNCDPHGKDLKRDEPEPVRQSQEKDTKVKKPEERKEEIMEKKWTTMFQKLLDYKKQYHGSLDTLFSGEDIKKCETAKGTATTKLSTEEREIRKLRRWCEEQKRLHFKWAQDKSSSSFFTQEKYDKLKEVGFDFPEPRWDEQYKKLKAYKDTHGTLKVERKHDLCLYRWSVRQRNILGKHFEGKPVNMSQERLKKLAELGWQKALDKRSKVRDKANEQKKWDEKFQELLMYKEKNGHMSFSPCNIKNDEFIRIRYWVRKIRKEYQKLQSGKESTLTAMQMKRLSDIGFDFNPHGINGNKSHKERWELRLQALKEYKARKGDFTLNEREDPKMYNIILNIRKAYKAREKGAKNGLTDERIAQLEEIGFDFTRRKAPTVRDVPRSWEERFQQLLQFKEEFGHCQVPLNYGGVLGDWVRRQRMFYRKLMAGEPSPLTHEKALRLSSVGFCFE